MDVANTVDMDFLSFSVAQFDGVSESDQILLRLK